MASTAQTTAASAAPCEHRSCRSSLSLCRARWPYLLQSTAYAFFRTPDVSFDMDSFSTTAVLVLLGLVQDCIDLEGPENQEVVSGNGRARPYA
jgi:hypothetical protein